jgi:hypothetical protein
MYSENGLIADIEKVREVIAESDVFGIGFRFCAERLFVDTRSNATEEPFVAMVAPLRNMHERMFWLGQQRPSLGAPERFVFFFWPNSVQHFQESGVWEAILGRVAGGGRPSVGAGAQRAMAELIKLEHQALVAAITGEDHRTLWQHESSPHNG